MSEWQPISTAPPLVDILVSVTYNTGLNEWETLYWVDFFIEDGDWAIFPSLIHIPFPPTHWTQIPYRLEQNENETKGET